MENKKKELILEKQALVKEKYLDFAIKCLDTMGPSTENLIAANDVIRMNQIIIKNL